MSSAETFSTGLPSRADGRICEVVAEGCGAAFEGGLADNLGRPESGVLTVLECLLLFVHLQSAEQL